MMCTLHMLLLASVALQAAPTTAVAPSKPPSPRSSSTWRFNESSVDVGLKGRSDGRLALADLNHDGRPDLVLSRRDVLLNTPDSAAPQGFRFVPVVTTLPDMGVTAVTAFADFDNDGNADAIIARDADPEAKPEPAVVFCKGNGDGSFAAAIPVPQLKPAHTAALAVGDVNGDGRLDLFRGNWYRKYGEALDATQSDLLLQVGTTAMPACLERQPLPEDRHEFDEEHDWAGRPTYGAMIAKFAPATERSLRVLPQIAQLNYGRRWNRLYAYNKEGWEDVALATGFDGDSDRTGKYPAFLAERAKTDKRFADFKDEKPFRSNGNTFDISVGDVNNDGLFDCFVAEITHAWAGPSADRSRFLIAERAATPMGVRFQSPPWACVDRIPPDGHADAQRWNQGDLFCELVDVNNDGRLDLVLASGDYPDAAPFEERLRVFVQRATAGTDGRMFEDVSSAAGIDLRGAAQLAVGDLDLDGDMDIVCGQSFTRFTKEMIEAEGGTPRIRVFINNAAQCGLRGTTLLLTGDPAKGVPRDAIGAVVVAATPAESSAQAAAQPPAPHLAQLVGPGGHSGKQRAFQVHFGGTTDFTVFGTSPGVTYRAFPTRTPSSGS